MEFKPEDIAKLVLGYLREHKCQTAFYEFLTSSPYLKEHDSNYRRGKYVATRVGGLSLVDYLAEYAVVYSIVQEHIEASDYYNERGLRTSLAQQLLYLLAGTSHIQSRTSTPIQTEVLIGSHEAHNINRSKSLTQSQNTINNTLDVSNENAVTPVQSVPSNSSPELSFLNSKNKSAKLSLTVDKCTEIEGDVDRETSQEICKEIFTQTFLENSVLIERLADNINKEFSAKSSTSEDPSNFHIGQELDNNAIETIIRRIAKDPIVVNSIEEIISNEVDESESPTTPNEEILNLGDDTELNISKERTLLLTPKKIQSTVSADSIKTRLRSSKKYSTTLNNVPSVEEQNNDVVQSIVAASLSNGKQYLNQELNTTNIRDFTSPTMGEVNLSEQPFENFINTGAFAGPSSQNQIYVNTVNSGGLLMVQPNIPSSCSNIVSTKALQVDTTKPYYIIGNQQFSNMIIPQTPLKLNSVITEQEIMAMPTIIVCDNNQQYTSSQTAIVTTSAGTCISTSQSHPRAIAPRKTVEKAQSLSEYISCYQCNDPSSPVIPLQSQLVTPSPNLRSQLKSTGPPTTDTKRVKPKTDKKPSHRLQTCKIQTPTETCTTEVSRAVTENTCASSKIEIDPTQEAEQNEGRCKPLVDSMPQILTPNMMIVQDVAERRSRSTPRNGSHVRQLDFSTPEKWCPLMRRANTSPKADRTSENTETPVKTCKAETTSSLPPADGDDKETDKNKVDTGCNGLPESIETSQTVNSLKSCSVNLSWDADLRALAAPNKPTENGIQKQKRKRSEESLKEHSSGKKPKQSLNKTEEDGLKIEIALNESQTLLTDTAKASQPNVKSVRRSKGTTKKASTNKKKKNDTEEDGKVIKPNKESNPGAPMKISSVEDVTLKVEIQQKVIDEGNSPEKQYGVINRHVKSRIKKKCNMENCIKKTQIPEEIVLTNITKIRSCEILDDSKNKLILSPSKLNANKRTLVEMENPVEISVTSDVDGCEVTSGKFITPELIKSSTTIPPVAAKRNIMPILETPVKFDSASFPKTPTGSSPPVIDTPFTKAVLEQLTGVDIDTIPTPKFPITPNVPFTPVVGSDQSPFSTRPTDYSTSSSYYQPSDTEQNKSLEQLIEECRKLDSQSVNTSKVDAYDGQTCVISAEKVEASDTTKELELREQLNISDSPEVTSVSDKMKAFNQSMIGKKNLQLVKMFSNETTQGEGSSSDDSSTGTSSSSSSDDSDSSESDGGVNTTPIGKRSPPYSLRSRKTLTDSTTPLLNDSREKVESQNTLNKEQHSAKGKEKSVSFQDGLLQEMEEKRQRTIARFKNATTKSKDSSKSKKPMAKSKASAKTTVVKTLDKTTSKKLGSSKTNKKTKEQIVQRGQSQELKLCDTSSGKDENCTILKQVLQLESTTSFVSTKQAKATVNDDKEIILHLSSDDENVEPSKMVEAVLLECPTSPSVGEKLDPKFTAGLEDQETTETWLKLHALMQMGIHLIPNKSVKKPVLASEQETEPPEKQTAENISGKNDQSTEELLSHVTTKDLREKVLEEELEKPVDSKYKINKGDTLKEPIEKRDGAKENSKSFPLKVAPKQKLDTPEVIHASKGKIEKREKKYGKLNRSLEEGELISDSEKSPRKEKRFKKADDIKRTESKSRSCKNDVGNTSQKNRLEEFKELYKYRSHTGKQSKRSIAASTGEKNSSSIGCNENISTKLHNKVPVNADIRPKSGSDMEEQPGVINELDYQVQFDNKTYIDETYRVAYDYSKESNRTLSDYNLDILTKKFSANVYIAEIDSEVEKFLTFTPFQFLIDIPPKGSVQKKSGSSRSSKEHISKHQPFKCKKKPLTILYNQLVKAAEDGPRPSPLEDLYMSEGSSRDCRRSLPVWPLKTGKSNKLETSGRSKHKSSTVKEKSSGQQNKSLELNRKSRRKLEEPESVASPIKTHVNFERQEPSVNTDLIVGDDQSSKRLPHDQNLEVVDGVIMLNTSINEEQKEVSNESNDDLMNYALVGSERVEDHDDFLSTDFRKRKGTEDKGENQQEKKQKTEELLRNIDVDSFLKKLHGET